MPGTVDRRRIPGCGPTPAGNYAAVVVDDERRCTTGAVEAYPDLPYFFFGHGWGSMIARGCPSTAPTLPAHPVRHRRADRRDDALDAGGTGGRRHERYRAGRVHDGHIRPMVVSVSPTCRPAPRWGPPTVCADHATDPLNGLATPMSNRFINDFVLLYDEVNDRWADGIDAALPVLIVAGELDPVANYGEGAFHVANSCGRAAAAMCAPSCTRAYATDPQRAADPRTRRGRDHRVCGSHL